MRHSKLLHSAIRGTEGVRPITARDKPPTFVGGMHSTHCLYDTGSPEGRQSGTSGRPSTSASKRAGGVATCANVNIVSAIGDCGGNPGPKEDQKNGVERINWTFF